MIDKASLALSPIWLNKMIGCTAKLSAAAVGATMFDGLTLLKTMERVGILPALAFAQVITYVVSNDYKISHFRVIKNNIKKVLFISCLLAGIFTLLFCLYPHFFLAILNKQNAYSDIIAFTLPFIAVLVIFDVIQLILSAALRGAGDVKTVMMTRLIVVGLIFIPMAYIIPSLPIENPLLKFALLYSSAPLSKALMGIVYIIRFKSGFWKKQSIQD